MKGGRHVKWDSLLARVKSRSLNQPRAAVQGSTGTIYLYREIGSAMWGGVSAEEFLADLAKLGPVNRLEVRINSIGGDVFEGIAIYNAIKNHPAKEKICYVDGIAASIATIIAMACKSVVMGAGTQFMIHNPAALTMGDASDFRALADWLDKTAGEMAGIYSAKCGKTPAECQALMDAETFFTGAEAVAAKFADVCDTPATPDNPKDPGMDMSADAVIRALNTARITLARIAAS
jgi:ATP-dependent protease ClpP protease subunit